MTNREGFNLLHKFGRYHFFQRGLFGDKWARQYVLQDTFAKYVCMIIGHGKTFKTGDYPPIICCYRCLQQVEEAK